MFSYFINFLESCFYKQDLLKEMGNQVSSIFFQNFLKMQDKINKFIENVIFG